MRCKPSLLSLGLAAGLALASVSQVQAKGVLVHLFQWKYNDVANECEKVLGPKGYQGVQITSPAEHIQGSSWWVVYQPVNYKNFTNQAGTETELKSMITRCKAAGVEIYADAVFNQLANGSGTGTGGSSYNGGSFTYPYFSYDNFHHAGTVSDYTNADNVQNGALLNMPDLNTGTSYVQGQLSTYLKTLLGWGVAGFRIDAAKHISVSDLSGILSAAGNPTVYQEVIGASGEAVQPSAYTGLGYVTEFNYATDLANQFTGSIKNLSTLGESWGLLSSSKAQVFVTNHDRERGQGGSGTLTYYNNKSAYLLANVFMMAWNYGWPQVMSGYSFSSTDDGGPSATACSSGSNWTCEHRLPTVANMVVFHNLVDGTAVTNWQDNGSNLIGFGRGSKGFVVINNESSSQTKSFTTGLSAGTYCNILAADSLCSGSTVTVDSSGKASITAAAKSAVAILADCTTSSCPASSSTSSSSSSSSSTTDSSSSSSTTSDDSTVSALFSTLYFRGTSNSWGKTAMTVDSATRIWSTTITFTGASDSGGAQRFKLDVKGDWSENYGDTTADGILDKSSSKDIYFTGVGTYLLQVKESDLSYTLTKVSDDSSSSSSSSSTSTATTALFSTLYYRGTTNSWGKTAMTVDLATRIWYATIDFTGVADSAGAQRFKLDVNGDWSVNYGDTNADGILDKNSTKDIYFTGVGKYLLQVKESDLSYSLTAVTENAAPVAAISPATITVTQGETLVLDASGSTDDHGIASYSWSTGGTGKTESVTFDTAGTQKVTVTVTDAAGLTSTATATVTVTEPVVADTYASNFDKLYYRGSSNSWSAQSMELVADHTWRTTITLTGVKNERFKIDASEDMSKAYGDRDDDGNMELNTSIFPGYKGVMTLTVNDETLSYTLEKQGTPYTANLESLFYTAPKSSGKGWDYLPMKLISNNLWYVRVKWSDVANQRFRFDIGGLGVKSQILGDSDKNGVVDAGGAPIAKSGKGYFIIKLNDKSMKYSVVAQ